MLAGEVCPSLGDNAGAAKIRKDKGIPALFSVRNDFITAKGAKSAKGENNPCFSFVSFAIFSW
jgi:hypothetical protein